LLRTEVRKPGSICYYITASGFEVDFAVGDPDMGTARSLVQVCADLSDKATRTREVRALTEAMNEMNLWKQK